MFIPPREFIAKYGITPETIKKYSVGATPVLLAPNNPDRFSLIVVNIGAEKLMVAPTQNVSLTDGINVPSTGGLFSVSTPEDGLLPTMEWYGVSTSVGTTVWVMELEVRK